MSALPVSWIHTTCTFTGIFGLWFWGKACRDGQWEKVRASVVYSYTSMGVFLSVIYILQLNMKEVHIKTGSSKPFKTLKEILR